MEQINNLVLKDESVFPSEAVLEGVLGLSYRAYEELLKIYRDNGLSTEWRYYNDGKAWLCKVQKKKKTIVWMSAWKGYMKATIYFPLRLIENVYSSGISSENIERIKDTKNVGKSKPCMFDIHDSGDLADFTKVMHTKITCK